MFASYTNSQFIADGFKRLVGTRAAPDQARALQAVATFERCGWQPVLFQEIVDEVAHGRFRIDARRIDYDAGDSGVSARTAIADILERYIHAVAPCEGVEA